jgi:hypothetical protein
LGFLRTGRNSVSRGWDAAKGGFAGEGREQRNVRRIFLEYGHDGLLETPMKKFILPVLTAALFGTSLLAAGDTKGESKGKKAGCCAAKKDCKDMKECKDMKDCKGMKDCKEHKAKEGHAPKAEAPKA